MKRTGTSLFQLDGLSIQGTTHLPWQDDHCATSWRLWFHVQLTLSSDYAINPLLQLLRVTLLQNVSHIVMANQQHKKGLAVTPRRQPSTFANQLRTIFSPMFSSATSVFQALATFRNRQRLESAAKQMCLLWLSAVKFSVSQPSHWMSLYGAWPTNN